MILNKISYQPQKLFVNTFTTDESDEVELLELSTDKELNFSKAIDKLFVAPLTWMFCRKGLYSKMQKIHHETLKVIYLSNKTYK